MNGTVYGYVMEQLAGTKGYWPIVAKDTGLSVRTISKIARKEIQDPRISKVEVLYKYFKQREKMLRAVSNDG